LHAPPLLLEAPALNQNLTADLKFKLDTEMGPLCPAAADYPADGFAGQRMKSGEAAALQMNKPADAVRRNADHKKDSPEVPFVSFCSKL